MNALFEAKVERLPPGRVDHRGGTRTVFVVDDLQVAFSAGITGHLPSEALRQALDKKVCALMLGAAAWRLPSKGHGPPARVMTSPCEQGGHPRLQSLVTPTPEAPSVP